MMQPHSHPDLIILKARLDEIDRGFQPKRRDYQKTGSGASNWISAAIVTIAAVSIVVVQFGFVG